MDTVNYIKEDNVETAMREYVFTQKVHGTQYALAGWICRDAIRCRAEFDRCMDAMVMRLYASIYGRKCDHQVVVKSPADWWQAFRERWFPRIWLQTYPLRYKETVVCAEEFLPYRTPTSDTNIISRVYIHEADVAGK